LRQFSFTFSPLGRGAAFFALPSLSWKSQNDTEKNPN